MIVIIDYGMGNIGSIANMLKKIGARFQITSDPAVIENSDKLILPGVGAFDQGIKNLERGGLIQLLNRLVLIDKIPILGICLGMQLFSYKSEEGVLSGLGWLDAESIRLRFNGAIQLPVPHMGWNTITPCQSNPIFFNLGENPKFYFVHSYHVVCANQENVLATANYGFDFTAMVIKENIIGTQFHPEKSHSFGLRLLKNFSERV